MFVCWVSGWVRVSIFGFGSGLIKSGSGYSPSGTRHHHYKCYVNNFTEPCKECPNGTGIEVFHYKIARKYTEHVAIYGHYQLQSELINGRAYFKSRPTSKYAIWWDGTDSWNIGFESKIGTKSCFGYFVQDVLCPHQIKEWNGMLNYGNFGTDNPWVSAGNSLCLR